MELIEKVYKLGKNIVAKQPKNFSGIGLVIYDSKEFDKSKHCSLRPYIECKHYSIDDEELVDYLIEISNYLNVCHDGFHMMNEEGILTHVAQYFVPPIVEGLVADQSHGVRLHSSLCGSTMKGVLFILAICSDESIYIMRKGEKCELKEEFYV